MAVPDQEIPGPPNRDPDSRSRPNRESGDFPIPDSRPNREWGVPSPIPGKKNRESGDPIPDSRVTSEHQPQWTRIYSAASIMPVLSQAACGSYSESAAKKSGGGAGEA